MLCEISMPGCWPTAVPVAKRLSACPSTPTTMQPQPQNTKENEGGNPWLKEGFSMPGKQLGQAREAGARPLRSIGQARSGLAVHSVSGAEVPLQPPRCRHDHLTVSQRLHAWWEGDAAEGAAAEKTVADKAAAEKAAAEEELGAAFAKYCGVAFATSAAMVRSEARLRNALTVVLAYGAYGAPSAATLRVEAYLRSMDQRKAAAEEELEPNCIPRDSLSPSLRPLPRRIPRNSLSPSQLRGRRPGARVVTAATGPSAPAAAPLFAVEYAADAVEYAADAPRRRAARGAPCVSSTRKLLADKAAAMEKAPAWKAAAWKAAVEKAAVEKAAVEKKAAEKAAAEKAVVECGRQFEKAAMERAAVGRAALGKEAAAREAASAVEKAAVEKAASEAALRLAFTAWSSEPDPLARAPLSLARLRSAVDEVLAFGAPSDAASSAEQLVSIAEISLQSRPIVYPYPYP